MLRFAIAGASRARAALALAGALATASCDPWLGREADHRGDPAGGSASARSPLAWVWMGALQPTSAVVRARLTADGGNPLLLVAEADDFENPRRFLALRAPTDPSALTFHVDGLAPGREHHYAVELDGALQRQLTGRFTTPVDGPFSFTVALGACARTGSNHPVFDEIREHRPLLFLHLGDFHYENVSSRDPDEYRRAFDRVLASPRQSALYRAVPVAYVWDDHDFAGNDSDRSARGREAARLVYRELVPHYPLAQSAADAPIHQAFVLGRVLFVMTDSRSERTAHLRPDGPRKTMLGDAQKAWLLERLSEAPRYGLVVWVNTLPWIAPRRPGADHWGGYAAERHEIASFVAEREIDNLLMLSGDAHMLAIDDGRNNRFAGGREPGFPVLHAAALDRDGSVKGGPYSSGTFPGGGQYGLMRVADDGGDRIHVEWSGRRHGGGVVVSLERDFTVPPPARARR